MQSNEAKPSETKQPPIVEVQPANEFDNFKCALKTILSVRKSDLDVHKPIPKKRKPSL